MLEKDIERYELRAQCGTYHVRDRPRPGAGGLGGN